MIIHSSTIALQYFFTTVTLQQKSHGEVITLFNFTSRQDLY